MYKQTKLDVNYQHYYSLPAEASLALTNRPFTRFLVSALAFLDSYRICLSYLHIHEYHVEIRKRNAAGYFPCGGCWGCGERK